MELEIERYGVQGVVDCRRNKGERPGERLKPVHSNFKSQARFPDSAPSKKRVSPASRRRRSIALMLYRRYTVQVSSKQARRKFEEEHAGVRTFHNFEPKGSSRTKSFSLLSDSVPESSISDCSLPRFALRIDPLFPFSLSLSTLVHAHLPSSSTLLILPSQS